MIRLVAGLYLDPLWNLSAPQTRNSKNEGPTFKGGGEGRVEREGKVRG